MKTRLLFLLLILSFGLGLEKAAAQTTCTWAGGTGAATWSNTNNWNILGFTGFSYPGNLEANDLVYFGSNANVTITAPLPMGSVYEIEVANGVTVNLTLASGVTLKVTNIIQVGTSTATTALNIIGPGDINGTSAITIYGGATLSNNSTASIIAASLTFPGSTGTFTNNGGCTLSGAITVNGNGTIGGSATTTAATMGINNGYTLTVNEPVTMSGAITISSNNTTVAGTALLQGASMTLNGGNTYTFNTAVTTTGNWTVANSATITSASTATSAAINVGGNLANANNLTVSTYAAFTVTGTFTVTSSTVTLSNSPLVTLGNLTVGAYNMTVDCPLYVPGTFSHSNSSITGNSSGTITAFDMTISNGGSFNLAAACSVTGTMTVSGGNTISFTNSAATTVATISTSMSSNATGNPINFATALSVTNSITGTSNYTELTNTKATTAAAITGSGGTLQIGSNSVSTPVTVTGATTSVTAATITLYNSSITTGTMALAGPLDIYGTCTVTSNGTANTLSGGLVYENAAYNLTILGSGTTTITGTTTMPGNDLLTVGSSTATTVNFGAGAVINITSNNNGGITNYGQLNFNGTSASPITLTSSTPGTVILNSASTSTITAAYTTFTFNANTSGITNNGSFTATGSFTVSCYNANSFITNTKTFTATNFTFNTNNSSTSTGINNSGAFTVTTGTINLAGSPGFINNTAGTFSVSKTAITLSGNNGYITNGGSSTAFTANGASTITMSGDPISITNSGYFYMGTTAGSYCITSFTNQGSITNSGYFYVGSTSELNLGTANPVTVTNSAYFTFQSDKYGSASIGQLSSTNEYFTGNNYYIERYITGGSTSYRSYRLLSSAVNISSSKTGTGNINLSYINTQPTGETNTYGALTAGSGSGFTLSNPNPTIYLYRESNPSSNTSFISGKFVGLTSVTGTTVNWVSTVAPTTGSSSIPVGNGYLFYFIGDTHSTVTSESRVPDNTTITASGYPNQQSVAVTIGGWSTNSTSLGYTSSYASKSNGVNTLGSAGFNLVGNPYASVIDLKKLYSDNSSNGYTTFYELNDVDPSQGYVSYNGKDSTKSSTTLSSRWIASGQGFFVQATAASQTINFKEDQKVYSPSGILYTGSTPPILLSLRRQQGTGQVNDAAIIPVSATTNSIIPPAGISGLHLMMKKDSSAYRECGIYFKSSYADNYDNDDAYDLDGPGIKVYMSSFTADGVRTGINAMSEYTRGKRIKLYAKATSDGIYNISLEDINNIDTTNYNVFLIDTKQNDSLDMVHYKTYAFSFTVADTASYHSRFVLAIEHKQMPPYKLITFTGQKVSDGVQLNWTTENEGNFTGFAVQKQGQGSQYNSLYTKQGDGTGNYYYTDPNPATGANIYRLQQNDINGAITYSALVTVVYNTSTANNTAFTIYPNPSKSLININLNSTSTSTLNLQSNIYNTVGQLMGHRTVNTNTWSEDVTAYKAGVYIIELKDNAGNLVGKSKFVKTN